MAGKPSKREMKQIQKELAKLEDVNGTISKLPSSVPDYWDHTCKMDAWLSVTISSTEEYNKHTPYSLLNGANSELTLKMASVKFHELRAWATGDHGLEIQFYDMKAIQLTQSGNPIVEGYGTPDAMQFLVPGMGITGHVTARKITFPKHIREMQFDVNDKLTPLFRIRGQAIGFNLNCLAKVTLYGYPQKKPVGIDYVGLNFKRMQIGHNKYKDDKSR